MLQANLQNSKVRGKDDTLITDGATIYMTFMSMQKLQRKENGVCFFPDDWNNIGLLSLLNNL